MKRIITFALLLIMTGAIILATGCKKEEAKAVPTNPENPQVTIEMDDGKKIVIELMPEYAPNSVNNFIALVQSGYYDGVVFHRVIPDFMIQGGDPTGTGMGGPGYMIKGEFANNGFTQNTLKHTRGVISMARQGNPFDPPAAYNTAGSQFFIMHADSPFLDNDYAAFGKVLTGLEVVDEIVSVPTVDDIATNPRIMKKVTVDTMGKEYSAPETIAE